MTCGCVCHAVRVLLYGVLVALWGVVVSGWCLVLACGTCDALRLSSGLVTLSSYQVVLYCLRLSSGLVTLCASCGALWCSGTVCGWRVLVAVSVAVALYGSLWLSVALCDC